MRVLKFGGTSVGSIEAISKVIEIVKKQYSENQSMAMVCSAMQGVTTGLNELLDKSEKGEDIFTLLKTIEDNHYLTVRTLLDVKRQNQALLGLKIYFNEMEELFAGIRALGEASPRIRDKVLSYGELLSCFMMSHIIDQHCGKAVFADTRNLIKTDNRFGKANIKSALTNTSIKAFVESNAGHIPVFTGFIAGSETGETTTLGRGGSDYTASIIGAALDAEEIQIWTDVDGIMTADPRLVKKSFSIDQLSYFEAIELSFFGARVIHPPTMLPAQRKNIPIVIKNTFHPEFKGTVICRNPQSNGSLIKGISFIHEINLITVQGSGMVGQKGFSGRLFKNLADAGVNVILITQASSEHSISLAVSPQDSVLAIEAIQEEFEQELALKKIHKPHVEEDLSVIAVVGENMKNTRGLSGRFFSALGRSGVNVVAIAQGSSELNISTVISRTNLAKAMNSVHDAMFLSPVKTLNVFCCGLGNIGSTLLKQIEEHQEYLEERRHLKINLAGICNSKKMLIDADGINISKWREEFDGKGVAGNVKEMITHAVELNLSNAVFLDNTASADVASLYASLFKQSISVVACNKIAVSGSLQQYKQNKELSNRFGVDFWYETSVGAGLPIIKPINDLMISGDRIIRIEAILSGTISYIFNNYKGDKTFYEVVKDAQQKGFTEPNPKDDLSGLDFARKMLILSRERGLDLEMEDIEMTPILPENALQAETPDDFYEALRYSEFHFQQWKEKAAKENKAMHFVGTLYEGKVKIGLQFLASTHPFYNLTGSDNIISLTTNRYLHNPMVIKGPGAGAEVTAAGVLADLVRVAAK